MYYVNVLPRHVAAHYKTKKALEFLLYNLGVNSLVSYPRPIYSCSCLIAVAVPKGLAVSEQGKHQLGLQSNYYHSQW